MDKRSTGHVFNILTVNYPNAIGINLGTVFSCVSVCQNGIPRICPNSKGSYITPSCVLISNIENLVGKSASKTKSKNLIFDVNRLIGKEYGDPSYEEFLEQWQFVVVEKNERLKIQTKSRRNHVKTYYPEEINGIILEKMVSYTKVYLDIMDFDKAVIAVPVYFDDAQIQSTKVAASFADIKVLRIISEPIAAVMAYGLNKNKDETKHVIVFDLNNDNFNVSVLTIFNGNIHIVAEESRNDLRGKIFIDRMVNYYMKTFEEKYEENVSNINERKNSVAQLRNACEEAIVTYYTGTKYTINIENFYRHTAFKLPITRNKYESINHQLIKESMTVVEKCLSDAKIETDDISNVILVGGFTRIPKIQKYLDRIFPGKILNSIDEEQVVAYGAAILAEQISKNQNKLPLDNSFIKVTSSTLGNESTNGLMSVIIEKHTKIPVKCFKIFSKSTNDQNSILIKIYEGQHTYVKDNIFLGEFELNISSGSEILVFFSIDSNGVLLIDAAS